MQGRRGGKAKITENSDDSSSQEFSYMKKPYSTSESNFSLAAFTL